MIPMKPKHTLFTDEQWEAIHISGNNVIVSAGAGSGKTSVLTERVIQKLLNGHKITSLLVLTFTNAAASEMKHRIRESLKKSLSNESNAQLSEALEFLDVSQITTFDSYCLYIVKKYSHLLNISKDIEIGDKVILDIAKRKILKSLFESLYKENDLSFINYLKTYTSKGLEKLESQILQISDYMSKNNFQEDYIDTYFDHFFTDSFYDKIEKDILFELGILKTSLSYIFNQLTQLETTTDKGEACKSSWLDAFANFKDLYSYGDYYRYLYQTYEKPSLRLKGLDDSEKTELKSLRDSFDKIIAEMKKIVKEEKDVYEAQIQLTKPHISFLLGITKKFNQQFQSYQHTHQIYDFSTIASLATYILKNFDDARNQMKDTYHEILIDEYQDTSFLQNELIDQIANHNVFMVGDIKQSIYRFRDAVPEIFQSNYVAYTNNPSMGYKIDLNANFRSRQEILHDINEMFKVTMDQTVGGINYDDFQMLIYGNKTYETYKCDNQPYGISILKTNIDEISEAHKDLIFSQHKPYYKLKSEAIHAQTIVRDIKEKIFQQYQVFDKDTKSLRTVRYDDFVILIDRSTSFDLFKQIFEHHSLPLFVHKEQKFVDHDDILAIRSMLKLIMSLTSTQEAIKSFKHAFMSFGRSFILNIDDQTLIEALLNIPEVIHSTSDYLTISKNENIMHLLNQMMSYAQRLDELTIDQLLVELINEFDVIYQAMSLSSVESVESRVLFLIEKATTLAKMGYHLSDLLDYFDYISENDLDIDYAQPTKLEKDTINMMTIHKSKGLEFPIVYFPLLFKSWNKTSPKDIYFDKPYGLIIQAFNEGLIDTMPKFLVSQKDNREMISERLRQFYVALTRAKEHAILILNEVDDKTYMNQTKSDQLIDTHIRQQFMSFEKVVYASLGNINHHLDQVSYDANIFTTDYLMPKKDLLLEVKKRNTNVTYNHVDLSYKLITKSRYSQSLTRLTSKDDKRLMAIGKHLHSILESIDFKGDIDRQLTQTCHNDSLCLTLKNIKKLPIFTQIESSDIYKEFEFIDVDDGIEKNGIIDLLIINDNNIYIVDYKLKEIEKQVYIDQVNGYASYIAKIYPNHQITSYIFSLLDHTYLEV